MLFPHSFYEIFKGLLRRNQILNLFGNFRFIVNIRQKLFILNEALSWSFNQKCIWIEYSSSLKQLYPAGQAKHDPFDYAGVTPNIISPLDGGRLMLTFWRLH